MTRIASTVAQKSSLTLAQLEPKAQSFELTHGHALLSRPPFRVGPSSSERSTPPTPPADPGIRVPAEILTERVAMNA